MGVTRRGSLVGEAARGGNEISKVAERGRSLQNLQRLSQAPYELIATVRTDLDVRLAAGVLAGGQVGVCIVADDDDVGRVSTTADGEVRRCRVAGIEFDVSGSGGDQTTRVDRDGG